MQDSSSGKERSPNTVTAASDLAGADPEEPARSIHHYVSTHSSRSSSFNESSAEVILGLFQQDVYSDACSSGLDLDGKDPAVRNMLILADAQREGSWANRRFQKMIADSPVSPASLTVVPNVQPDDEWPYGFGQGAPVDEKGHYILSQIGMPVVASPVVASPGLQADLESRLAKISPSQGTLDNTDVNLGTNPSLPPRKINNQTFRVDLKRKRNNSDDDSFPQTPTPCRIFQGVTNSPNHARSMPVQEPRAKRQRLRSPFNLNSEPVQGSRIKPLELGAVTRTELKEFTQGIKETLTRQTEVLSEILQALKAKELNVTVRI
ncbi:hypothetical protein JVT61DRAFT_14777 [Boletus reticuloceps]|uniref:Uncharacterized protein n=1 Tax=Boletus reticuloceps TaxID=495285 RepID=A0A8I2YTB7_9AGAM|nr:hypothetical protein JVT61DRAFT_14777 [Boletus reticuloceps]